MGTDVILTGLLVETLEELAEIVMIETSLKETGGIGVFRTKSLCYLSGTERLLLTKDS